MNKRSCTVIDYGIGNIFSVMHALDKIGVTANLTADRSAILSSDSIILPGVGAFGKAAARLKELGLAETIYDFIKTERPFLGICVGMQLLMGKGFEFGEHDGLGIIPGAVKKIEFGTDIDDDVRIPLIGWHPLIVNDKFKNNEDILMNSMNSDNAYYFVHSYEVCPENEENIVAWVDYGGNRIAAAIRQNNVYGVQFHPERSDKAGLQFLDIFFSKS